MEFRTKTVVNRKNKKARVAYVGLGIALSSMAVGLLPNGEDYIGYVFMAGIVIVIIGAFIAKGDITDYGLGDDFLVVTTEGIDIGAQHYPMEQIRSLDFNVEGFAGMGTNSIGMPAGTSSDGMGNELSFVAGDTTVNTRFYLEGPQHVQVLGALFKAFYELHIPFIERNKSARTYLFQVLSAKELEDFKLQYGY